LGLQCPAFATVPVRNLGAVAVSDLRHAITAIEDFDLFTNKDIDAAFERLEQLRYSQPFFLSGKEPIFKK